MGDMNLAVGERVENEIAQTRYNDDPRLRLIGLPALKRRPAKFLCPIDQPRHHKDAAIGSDFEM